MKEIDWSGEEDKKLDLMRLICSLADYRSDGFLVWSDRVGKKDRAGIVVGSVSPSDGYRYTKCRGRRIAVHRVIFFMHHGYCPPEVDHINRNRTDNRIENLRDPLSHSNNLGNQSHQVGTSSRFKGVCWDKNRSKWIAMIKINRRNKFLGRFNSEEDAATAYNRAAYSHFGEFANLNEVPMDSYRKQVQP